MTEKKDGKPEGALKQNKSKPRPMNLSREQQVEAIKKLGDALAMVEQMREKQGRN